MFKHNPTD